jgi:hypothetical protein
MLVRLSHSPAGLQAKGSVAVTRPAPKFAPEPAKPGTKEALMKKRMIAAFFPSICDLVPVRTTIILPAGILSIKQLRGLV